MWITACFANIGKQANFVVQAPLEKVNLQPQYLSAYSHKSGETVHERETSTPKVAVSGAYMKPQESSVAQPRPSVSLEIQVGSPNPLDATPLSADRRVSAYQKIAKLL
jgi:hypothetical protein